MPGADRCAEKGRFTAVRTDWPDLPAEVHDAVQAHTGPVIRVAPVAAGRNCELAAVLHTVGGRVFAKGNRAGRSRTQRTEAAISPYVAAVSPRVLWRVEREGWDVLGFEHVPGRRADLAPGSHDLPVVADALARMGAVVPPVGMSLLRIEHRWREHGDQADLALLAGDSLLHTDLHPDNVLVSAEGAWFVDWAWPTLGAPWIEPALVGLWLIVAGHTPAHAEAWAAGTPAWARATPVALDVFTAAAAHLWQEIADTDTQEWTRQLADAARVWAEHRGAR